MQSLLTSFFTWFDEKLNRVLTLLSDKHSLEKQLAIPHLHLVGPRAFRVDTPSLHTMLLLWWSGSHQKWPEPILLKAAKKFLLWSPRVSARSCSADLDSLCPSLGHKADQYKQSGAWQARMHVDFLRHSFCTGFGQRKDIQENRSRVSSSSVDSGTAFGAQDRGAIRCPEAQEPSISALVDPVPITSDQQATSTCLS